MTLSDARLYFKKAKEDLVVITKLVDDLDIADSSWGFHAHQTAEKLIKAILAKEKIEFPRSHDLVYLLELLPASAAQLFQHLGNDCENLNPFAVSLRYDDSFEGKLERSGILERLTQLATEIETKL